MCDWFERSGVFNTCDKYFTIIMSLKEVNKRISSFEETMKEFQARLQDATACSPRGDTLQSLNKEFAEFQGSVSAELGVLKSELQSIQHRLNRQEEQIDEAEQYSRRNCLLLHGIPEEINEDSYDKVIKTLNEKLDVHIKLDDIDRCHRLGPLRRSASDVVSKGKRPIIVKLLRYHDRDRIWRKKRCLKGTGILVTESLTRTRQEILHRAREIFGLRRTWTQDGRIVLLQDNGHKSTITTMNQLTDVLSTAG